MRSSRVCHRRISLSIHQRTAPTWCRVMTVHAPSWQCFPVVQHRLSSHQERADTSSWKDLPCDSCTAEAMRRCVSGENSSPSSVVFSTWGSPITGSTTIKKGGKDSKTLWNRVNYLLRPNGGVCNPHSASAFTEFFDGKVSDIRSRTADMAPSFIVLRDVQNASQFDSCTSEEVARIIQKVPISTELDHVPTWLVKQCCDVLASFIALLTNRSFQETCFPDA